jgi:hypothetical protein
VRGWELLTAGLELAAPVVDDGVLAGSGLDVLGLAAGGLDGAVLDGAGLAGGGLDGAVLDGAGLAGGGPDGLELDRLGRGDGLAQGPGLGLVTVTGTRRWAARLTPATLGVDRLVGVGMRLAVAVLDGLGLTVGDVLDGLGLDGDGLVGLELSGLGLAAGWADGLATAGVDDAQLAAGCP